MRVGQSLALLGRIRSPDGGKMLTPIVWPVAVVVL